MKLAIMQPYLFPYIGYFQLINAVDEFVIYDIIEYSKGGWINRNRILHNNMPDFITIPIKKDSDYLSINERFLADTWKTINHKLLNLIIESYRKAPYFDKVISIIKDCLFYSENNLFKFIFHSLNLINDYLNIHTPFIISSTIDINPNLKSVDKVINICMARNADIYINPIGGVNLYSKIEFRKNNIDLYFLNSNVISYKQFDNEFIPNLSIIDVMMFNSRETIKEILEQYKLQ